MELDLTLKGWERATADMFTWKIDVVDSEISKGNESLSLEFTVNRNNIDVAVKDADGAAVCAWEDGEALAVETSGMTVSFKGEAPADATSCGVAFTAFALATGDTVSFELNLDDVPDTTPLTKAAPQKIGITGTVMVERMDDASTTNINEAKTATYRLTGEATYDPPTIQPASN